MSLYSQLKKAQDEYYQTGSSTLSDKEYDELLEQLKIEDKAAYQQLLSEVGSDLTQHWDKFEHKYKMGSLSKCNTFEEFTEWAKKFRGGYIVEEKLDGISVSLYYDEGKITRAVSRGNGEVGDEFTRNVIKMRGVPKTIKFKGEFVVRAEIVLKHSDWQKMPEDKRGKNPRNTAAGAAKKLNGELCDQLSVIAYDILNVDEKDTTDFLLANYGFTVAFRKLCSTPEECLEVYNEYVTSKRSSLDWDIDGLVIKTQKVYPEEDWRKPKNAIAWKFPHQYVETYINEISWQTSGERVTPVAHFQPVECAGVTVSKASLHNWKFIEKLGITEHCKVLISRRNDVIPYVEEVLARAPEHYCLEFPNPPTECPCCSGKVEFAKNIDNEELEYLVCTNILCPEKTIRTVMKWLETHDCKGVAEKTVELICDNFKVANLSDFFKVISNNDKKILSLEGMGDKKLENLKQQLSSTKRTTIEKFLGGLNIAGFGKRMFRKIVDFLKDQQQEVTLPQVLRFIQNEDLTRVEGFSDNSNKTLKKHLDAILPVIVELEKLSVTCSTEKATGGGLKGLSFCFTGSLDTMKRKDAEEIVVAQGGKISSVNKNLTYLVTNDTSSGSSKNKKASSLGVQIIDENKFRELVGL